MNIKNISFYDRLGVERFEDYVEKAGMDTCPDLDIIYPEIAEAAKIVELGAGTGRVIRCLRKRGFQGKIEAIERVPSFLNHLVNMYQSECTLLKEDILNYKAKPQSAVFLWLWSGIMEYSPDEQKQAFLNISGSMASHAYLFVDLPYQKVQAIGVHKSKQYLELREDFGVLQAYLPTYQEMITYAKNSKLDFCTRREYETTKGYKRLLYQFQKV